MPAAPARKTFAARGAALLMVLVLLVLAWLQLRADHAAALRDGERLTGAMANAIEQHLGGSMRAIDDLMQTIAADPGRWRQPDDAAHLAARLQGFPELRYVALIDANGRFIGRPVPDDATVLKDLSLADQDFFLAQKTAAGPDRIRIGAPVVDPSNGERTVPLSRPVRDAGGHFTGIVLAALNPDAYARFLGSVLLEKAGASAVIDMNGVILARAPDHAAKFGTSVADSDLFTKAISSRHYGVLRLVSKADGHDKLLGYRMLDRYPLVVTSGLSAHTALRHWRQLTTVESVLILLFSLALLYWARQADLRQDRASLNQQRLEAMVEARTRDLSDSRELAERRARRLGAVNQELKRLAQVAAHHLQEPLRPIVSYSQLIRRKLGNQDDELTQWLDYMESGGLRLKILLRDFQRYATSLAEEPRRDRIDADAAFAAARQTLLPRLTQCGAELQAAPLPPLLADAAMLTNVFTQLLDNALAYRHPARPLKIAVSAVEEGDFWRFSVQDNGRGVPPGLTEKIFDAFERLGQPSPHATGLGLAICRAVVLAHGGRIWMESGETGSTVHFLLPRAPGAGG
ncbi:phytochrome-like protein cph1 [mine drainage metagenome]|uniref:histidine kinase n=1 Tax=mine drainage metagenome TaxID=410659 RepID=A0A1J5SCC0_9ZZZZ